MTYYTFHPHGPNSSFLVLNLNLVSHRGTNVSRNIFNCQAMKNCFANALSYICPMTKVTV